MVNAGPASYIRPDGFKRLAALSVASLLLCLSFVMSFFTSYPVSLGTLLYGRKKGYGAVALAWAASFGISFFLLKDPMMTLFVTYTASLFVTVATSEIALRNSSPMKGIVVGAIALSAVVFGSLYASFNAANLDVKEFVVKQINDNKAQFEQGLKQPSGEANEEAFKLLALLEQPEKLADKLISEAPAYIIMGILIILWANVFLLLKSKRAMLGMREQNTDRNLVEYKNPDQLIWAVIAALALAVFGDQLDPRGAEIGISALKILGVFYFFQGFGLYISFLDAMRLRGLLRTILVIATVMTASQVLAIVGLFDMFVNFRRFMKKKDQGE